MNKYIKRFLELNEDEFKRLYQGSFVSVDTASEQEDNKTVLVVAGNYDQFRQWQRGTKNKGAIYLGRPERCRGWDTSRCKLIKVGSWYANHYVIDSWEFRELQRRIDE